MTVEDKKLILKYSNRAFRWYAKEGAKKLLCATLGLVAVPIGLLFKRTYSHRRYVGDNKEYLEWLRAQYGYSNVTLNPKSEVASYNTKDIPFKWYRNSKDALGDLYWVRDHRKSLNSYVHNLQWAMLRNPCGGLVLANAGDYVVIDLMIGNRIKAFKNDPKNSIDGWSYIEARINGKKKVKGFYYRDTRGLGRGNKGLEIKIGAKLENVLWQNNILYSRKGYLQEDIKGTLQIGKKFIYN